MSLEFFLLIFYLLTYQIFDNLKFFFVKWFYIFNLWIGMLSIFGQPSCFSVVSATNWLVYRPPVSYPLERFAN